MASSAGTLNNKGRFVVIQQKTRNNGGEDQQNDEFKEDKGKCWYTWLFTAFRITFVDLHAFVWGSLSISVVATTCTPHYFASRPFQWVRS